MPKGISIHKLSNFDDEAMLATCAKCGDNSPVKMKAGRPKCRQAIRDAKKTERNYGKSKRQSHGLSIIEAQEFRKGKSCAICGATESLCVDHCHSTMIIRGVLCSRCNSGLGMFRDDPELLLTAIKYLAG